MIIAEGHHSLASDLKQIHNIVDTKYQIRKQATVDEKRAKKMEQYLRMFKRLGTAEIEESKNKGTIELSLEEQAMQQLAQDVGRALGIGQQRGYNLFGIRHQAYQGSELLKEYGADDIFELELASLLQLAGNRASQQATSFSMGVNIIGGQSGNVSQRGLKDFDKMLLRETVQEGLQAIAENAQELTTKSCPNDSKIMNRPVARSAKVDVTGYNVSWVINSQIRPEWEDFIRTFTGAKFTVKNYSSDSQTETIHLGNSDLYKAFYGTIAETLNIKPRTAATHTYFHAINSSHINDAEVSPHILHIRFIYELTGGGLYTIDSSGKEQKLDSADFFIYNDPASNNIWVRSTKSMIAHFINSENIQSVRDPLHSGIVVLKNSFN